MLGYLKDYKRESVLAPLFKMLEATFDLFVPLVMADIVNIGIAAHDFHYILVRCGILLLLAMIGLACSLTAQYFSAKAAVGYSTALRHALFEHIQTLSFTEMDTLGTSTLITRMTSDINQVQSGVNLVLRLFLRSPFIVFGAMIMAFQVNVRAVLIFVVAIPLLSIVVFGILLISMPLYKKVQKQLDRVLLTTRENLLGARVVRAFNRQQDEMKKFDEENSLLVNSQVFVGKISALMNPVTYVIVNGATIILIWTGAWQVEGGIITQGAVVALVNYMSQILVELVKLANLIITISKSLACANRISAVFGETSSIEDKADAAVLAANAGDAQEQPAKVEFASMDFAYAGSSENALSQISFRAMRGQTIGIIGGTGSGKSTLVNLIPRFYDVTGGKITVDGHDVRSLTLKSLRSQIGVVQQDVYLFSGSIRENIAYGKPDASEEEIIAAAKQYHTTVTVFLVSLLILSIYEAMEPRDRKKAVRIMVPVNLRSYFPSATVRNFFGLIAVTYDRKKQGETLEDVIAAVAENFRRELTKEKLEKMIAGQVSLEKHMAARAIPLIFKDIGMELSGLIAGARQTMYFSNIGRITMPKALAPYVCQFDFFIGCAGRQICMCSYEDHMMVTCAGSSSPKDTERAFFRRLAEFDSDMIINTNYSGKED
mgnify:CR=1 FL=1